MVEGNLNKTLTELSEEFESFDLKIRRRPKISSIVVEAEEMKVLRTVKGSEDLTEIVEDACYELTIQIGEKQARMRQASLSLASQRGNVIEVEVVEGWEPQEDDQILIEALEAELSATKRSRAAYAANLDRVMNRLKELEGE